MTEGEVYKYSQGMLMNVNIGVKWEKGTLAIIETFIWQRFLFCDFFPELVTYGTR